MSEASPIESPACWVCHGTRSALFRESALDRMTVDDVRITDARYGRTARMVRCEDCGFVYAAPLPTSDLVGLYEALDDPEYSQGTEYRRLPMEGLLDGVRRLRPHARTLLDVGASTGILVRAARDRGLDAEGVEPSTSLVRVAKQQNGVDIHQGIFPHPALEGRRFDVITAVDVIEHVADPVGLLRSMTAALAPGGLLVVTTPDVDSLFARFLQKRWWHYRPAHVCFFNEHSMEAALDRAGLRAIERERQAWFFPVGYLAERLAGYAPVPGLSDKVKASPLLAPLRDRVVRINLRDSWIFYCEPTRETRG